MHKQEQDPGANKLYTLPGGHRVGEAGAELYALVQELASKAAARQTQAELDAKIADFEAERRRSEEADRRRKQVAQERERVQGAQDYAEKAELGREKNLAEGLVEVRVDPGKPWTQQWFDDNVAHRVPGMTSRKLAPTVGTLAILRAVEIYEQKKRAGHDIKNPGGLVAQEAMRAMAKSDGPTTWVTAEVAAKMPHLVVHKYADTFAGRVSRRWHALQERIKSDAARAAMGLTPTWKRKGRPTRSGEG